MDRIIKVGTVSWIDKDPNPIWFAGKAKLLDPAWVPKTYVGLVATSNAAPPTELKDFEAYRRDREYRALMYCRIRITIDDHTKKVTAFEVLDAVHDGGWTPPFRILRYPTLMVFSILDGWTAFVEAWGFDYHQGEASSLSLVNTQARHRSTTMGAVPPNEIVLINGLIKFRAGNHTDRVGTATVGCPYHVPWVWCEMVLTYAEGRFKLYGRGSIYPSHAWYLDDKQVLRQNQVGDISFPRKSIATIGPRLSIPGPRLSIPSPTGINFHALELSRVLSKGAPANGPQTPLSGEDGLSGSVETHPNTVPGGKSFTNP